MDDNSHPPDSFDRRIYRDYEYSEYRVASRVFRPESFTACLECSWESICSSTTPFRTFNWLISALVEEWKFTVPMPHKQPRKRPESSL
ncbi:hypothetical protein TNCV_4588311 [Trichonephila clavipes]|nr:hypothetical protein TNCV_4588311 [Trichonephila clavipes]